MKRRSKSPLDLSAANYLPGDLACHGVYKHKLARERQEIGDSQQISIEAVQQNTPVVLPSGFQQANHFEASAIVAGKIIADSDDRDTVAAGLSHA